MEGGGEAGLPREVEALLRPSTSANPVGSSGPEVALQRRPVFNQSGQVFAVLPPTDMKYGLLPAEGSLAVGGSLQLGPPLRNRQLRSWGSIRLASGATRSERWLSVLAAGHFVRCSNPLLHSCPLVLFSDQRKLRGERWSKRATAPGVTADLMREPDLPLRGNSACWWHYSLSLSLSLNSQFSCPSKVI